MTFRRLLIANRGEIAVRIARAAREAGIVPLGIYSDADRSAAFLDAMDDAACVGPAPASESYLQIERILDAARTLRADALHPGYGFLSERADFARAVRAAGIIFVGPPPEALAAMGDKSEAKRRARLHGIPVIEGYDGEDQASEALRVEAERIGVPVLIKAAAGGGGRGMRVVRDLAEFGEALAAAKREALAGFGDDRVLLERYLAHPRHIEFQILADAHGNTIHLGERDCSVQRRHQKLVEEAPSPVMTSELRERMGEAAIRAAQSVGYVNAGTVEFLLDDRGAFYFLEMNARLQVEHPVTEETYGIDLVRAQLRIAAGERLDIAQRDIAPRGWTIEARVNAEDPAHGYLPAVGTLAAWNPPSGPGIRVDSGVRSGSEVTIYYDSLLAKVIAHGTDRASAIARLCDALRSLVARGVATNVPLLLGILTDSAFANGAATTAFLEERPELAHPPLAEESQDAFALAFGALLLDGYAWRIGGIGIPLTLRAAQREFSAIASRDDAENAWRFTGDLDAAFTFERQGERLVAHGKEQRLSGQVHIAPPEVSVIFDGVETRFTLARRSIARAAGDQHHLANQTSITAPMPGKILQVTAQVGDSVRRHSPLIVLEAMKMEHRLDAPRDGVVRTVRIAPGALVTANEVLIELE